ncbi:MAG: stage II sporulation protein R [Oscillospiraceae bacterium]|nr:stage II sporulation protein R [Oscillospiraceae bacterium]
MLERNTHFKAWELALLCALCLTLCAAVWAQEQTERISSSLIRLHVLAVDDSDEEQALKLRVRDAVLDFLAPRLEGIGSRDEAKEILSHSLPELQSAAAAAAEGRAVTVTLTRELYPTRGYGSFALPAGAYDSLRVILGKGEGHNWWCVVFPPICLSLESTEELERAVGEESFQILTSDGTALRFRLLELWGELTGKA